MQKVYKTLNDNAEVKDILDWIKQATRERNIDVGDYDNQVAINVSYFNYTPSSSSDLIGTEKAGDIATDTSYIYIVVDNAGTLQWQRVATATF